MHFDRFAFYDDFTGIFRVCAENSLEELASSVAQKACKAQNLALFKREGDVLKQAAGGKVFNGQGFRRNFGVS